MSVRSARNAEQGQWRAPFVAGAPGDFVRTAVLALRLADLLGGHWWRRIKSRQRVDEEFGPRLRHFLETSGVTAIKLGQYLAIRIDLLPLQATRELSRLFDAVPPIPFERVQEVIEGEFGAPLATLFSRFDRQPIGAASIAQVHRARDHAGNLLAVKVQRPGVAETLRSDFRILRGFAWLADRFSLFGSISAVELIDEVAAFTLREVDFLREGVTADEIRADAESGIHIPRIHWDLTTVRVLTMEFIEGTSMANIVSAAEAGDPHAFDRAAPGAEPAVIVETLTRACLRQLFVTGVFQGDPHPANVLIERDGTVAFVDFGIFGELTADDRSVLRRYVYNIALGRIDEAFHTYSQTIEPTAATDFAAYRRDTMKIMAAWYSSVSEPGVPPRERVTARFQGEMFQAMRQHHVRMRQDLVLFWRALAVLDSTAQRLPVGFNLLASMRRFFADDGTTAARVIRKLAFRPEDLRLPLSLHRNALRAGLRAAEQTWRIESVATLPIRREQLRATRAAALSLLAFGIAIAATASGGAAEDAIVVIPIVGAIACLVAAVAQAVSWRRA